MQGIQMGGIPGGVPGVPINMNIPMGNIPKTTIRLAPKSNSRKQPNRNNKRKSRKIVSSSEEESDYSDEDYA